MKMSPMMMKAAKDMQNSSKKGKPAAKKTMKKKK